MQTWSDEQLKAGVETKTYYTAAGEYAAERQALHDALVDQELEGHQPAPPPRLTLRSGGTASGKTAAAKAARSATPDCVYANTDEFRAQLPEFPLVEGTDKAGLLQEEAGDIRDQLLAEAVASSLNIVWDAPGSLWVADYLQEIERLGYQVTIAYTHRPVDEAKRAAARRAATASNPADRRVVPDAVIDGSHRKAREGFAAMARTGSREIIVYDMTGKQPGEPADVIYHRERSGHIRVYDRAAVQRFAAGRPPIDETVFD
ncbi:MAG: zeta toxin family protein [Vicinamibacterales bacterium]